MIKDGTKIKKTQPKLSNQRGFSLPELATSIGIASILVVTMGSILMLTKAALKASKAQTELDQVMDVVRSNLSNHVKCQSNLHGLDLSNGNPVNIRLFEYSGTNRGNEILGAGWMGESVQIDAATLTPGQSLRDNRREVTIHALASPLGISLGHVQLHRSHLLHVEVDASGKIVNCLNLYGWESSDKEFSDDLLTNICANIFEDRIARYYDPSTGKCEWDLTLNRYFWSNPNVLTQSCPAGWLTFEDPGGSYKECDGKVASDPHPVRYLGQYSSGLSTYATPPSVLTSYSPTAQVCSCVPATGVIQPQCGILCRSPLYVPPGGP